MAISIHHGPNGSYKTSGVIADFFIPAAIAGRTVVTNVRGMSTERTFQNLPDTAEGFEVIHVDTSTNEGRMRMAKWFHWAPAGALLLFDEPSMIFPKRWRDSDIAKLDNFEAMERAKNDPLFNETHEEYMPFSFNIAFEMHRHWNWDIVIMTPNIKLVRSDIRDTSEGAYKHRNNALIGFKGSYNEGFHKAEDNGTSPSQFLSVEKKKINSIVFTLYDSTKTGEHKDTSSGTSIFKNGRLLVSMAVSVVALGYSAFNFATGKVLPEPVHDAVQISEAVPVVSPSSSTIQDSFIPVDSVDSVQINPSYSLEPFAGYKFVIQGHINNKDRSLYFFAIYQGNSHFYLSSDELVDMGYSVISTSDCSAVVVFKQNRMNVSCGSLPKIAVAVGA